MLVPIQAGGVVHLSNSVKNDQSDLAKRLPAGRLLTFTLTWLSLSEDFIYMTSITVPEA
jgi:hypothetical protein